jgi:hypothetical protein
MLASFSEETAGSQQPFEARRRPSSVPPGFLRSFIFLNLAIGLSTPWVGATEGGSGFEIHRTEGTIKIDGDLSDPGWKDAARIDTWYETNPGDNVPPRVKNVGYVTYDDRYFYAGFEFFDPQPDRIRAMYGDRDNVPSYTDYGGVILDTRNDGKTGILFLANPRGIQYDAVSDDTTGNEDSSLDLYWDAAARITEWGWSLEIRIPLSSLRYGNSNPQTWGILLYRNYPREFRYQMFTSRIPRGTNCFICCSAKLTGLQDLPQGSHWIVAPYFTGTDLAQSTGSSPELGNSVAKGQLGLDAKWIPNVHTAVDAAVNPDFSQVESDVAQIAANQRFALFYPEKRPFFLEGLELYSTPIQAVYTRTITSPAWGGRITGKDGPNAYTFFATEDRGGGTVTIPGPLTSDTANQDFQSFVAMGRVRRDIGRSFVSLLMTDREVQGGGFNRIIGPDFQWRPNGADMVTGQLLLSDTQTPNKPDLSTDWNGQRLRSYAADTIWSHQTSKLDWYGEYRDFGSGFRADDGYVPQVGYREGHAEVGDTWHPSGLISRLRPSVIADLTTDPSGGLISQDLSVAVGMDGRQNSSLRVRLAFDRLRAVDQDIPRRQVLVSFQISPSRAISQIVLNATLGQELDFVNARLGNGTALSLIATLHPTAHAELGLEADRTWLDVEPGGQSMSRLFTAQVERARLTYTFSRRLLARLIAQYVSTESNPALYVRQVPDRYVGTFTQSALVSYKVNWQTVLFLGYGNDQTQDLATGQLQPTDRELFVKISYAFQR